MNDVQKKNLKEFLPVRIEIPQSINHQIIEYQKMFKKRFGVTVTKKDIVVRAIKDGMQFITADTERMETELILELEKMGKQ